MSTTSYNTVINIVNNIKAVNVTAIHVAPINVPKTERLRTP